MFKDYFWGAFFPLFQSERQWINRKGGRETGEDTQQRASGRTQTRAAAKTSAHMGRTFPLGELEVAPHFLMFPLLGKYICSWFPLRVSLLYYGGLPCSCCKMRFIL